MPINTEYFRKKLEEEKERLEGELSLIARKDPDSPSDWQALPNEPDVSTADENTVSDGIEEYEENSAIVNTLEARYKDIRSGLDKIKHGVFGTCQVCKKEIESDRLEANPAARTCKEHMN